MTRLKWFYGNFEEITGSVLLLVLLLIIGTLQITCRYLLEHPLSWTDETSRFVFVWLVMIGASLALKRNEHFALELFVDLSPRPVSVTLRLLGVLIVIATAAAIAFFGARMAWQGMALRTPALDIPYGVAYAAVPLRAFLMLLRSIEYLISRRWMGAPEHEKGAAS